MVIEENLALLMIASKDRELHKIYSVIKHMERKFEHLSNSDMIKKLLAESLIEIINNADNTEYKITEKGLHRIQALNIEFWDECKKRFPNSIEFIEYLKRSG